MILGIDASNIRAGGGITHLSNFFKYARPRDHAFHKSSIERSAKAFSNAVEAVISNNA